MAVQRLRQVLPDTLVEMQRLLAARIGQEGQASRCVRISSPARWRCSAAGEVCLDGALTDVAPGRDLLVGWATRDGGQCFGLRQIELGWGVAGRRANKIPSGWRLIKRPSSAHPLPAPQAGVPPGAPLPRTGSRSNCADPQLEPG